VMSVSYDPSVPDPVVVEVIKIEPLPIGGNGSRRAVVKWSDGTTGEALRWFADLCGYPHKSASAYRVRSIRRVS
jgi:hypothetical protein